MSEMKNPIVNGILKQIYQGYLDKNLEGSGIAKEELKSVYDTNIKFYKVNIVGLCFLEEVNRHGTHIYYAGFLYKYDKNVENGLLGKYNHDDIEDSKFFSKGCG